MKQQKNRTITYRNPAELVPFDGNARTHDADQITAIADRIRAHGFLVPILTDEHDTIIAGHGRLAAALSLDLKRVPTIRVAGLTDAQRRALTLADNSLADRSDWDADLLRVELEAISQDGDARLSGFTPAELDQMFVPSTPPTDPGPTFDEDIADDVTMVTCCKCGQEFPA